MSETKWREFWIQSLDKLVYGNWILEEKPKLERLQKDSTHVIEIAALQELKEENARLEIMNSNLNQQLAGIACLDFYKAENKKLTEKLRVAVDCLKQINREELNAQRPGGGYSKSAILSYQAIAKLESDNG